MLSHGKGLIKDATALNIYFEETNQLIKKTNLESWVFSYYSVI